MSDKGYARDWDGTPVVAAPSPPPGIPEHWQGASLTWTWQYNDVNGQTIGHVARFDDATGKAVVPFFLRESGSWKSGAAPEPRPLFGLDTLKDPNACLFAVEGEKCAAALHSLGLQAVTSLGGAQSPHKSDWTPLQAFERVVVMPDADQAGEGYAAAVVGILSALPGHREVTIARLPELPPHGDVVDWIRERIDGWDGFAPIPREPGDELDAELREAIEACAEAPPADWTAAAAPEIEAWESPVPLDAATIPPWPADVFPRDVQAFVDALSVSTETPRELSAMMVLAVLATATQGRYRVCVKPDYFEPTSLWTCCALQSGSRKTAVWQAATAPVAGWEAERRAELEPFVKRAQLEAKVLQARIDALERRAAKSKDPHDVDIAMQDIRDLQERMPDTPVLPQLWAADVTPENLATIMGENHECMSLLSDEGGMLDILAGRYSNGVPNLDVYLQGHAGSPVRVNRGSRAPVFLERPCLTIGICPQPDVVRALADKPGFRGRGLLGRFLYAMPHSNIGHRTGNAPPLPDYVRDAYRDTVRAILESEWSRDDKGRPRAHILKLSPEAYSAWAAFNNTNEAGMAEGGTFAHITDWAGKLPGAVARIAAVLHVARYCNETPWNYPVDAESIEPAIRLGEVLAQHALIAFDAMGSDPALDDARAILAWVRRERLTEFTRRDAHAAHRARFPRANDLDAPLAALEERGHIRRRPQALSPGKGRPSQAYEVNPNTNR